MTHIISVTPMSISIPAFREEGDKGEIGDWLVLAISIPAFREEGDPSSGRRPIWQSYFNPHLP